MTDVGNITDAERAIIDAWCKRYANGMPPATARDQLAIDLSASRVHPAGEPVAWRSVMNDPPIAVSVLARFFDNELGEWVYTVFDPGPVLLKMAGPYNEWLSLDTFNRPLYASIRAIEALTPGSPL